MTSAAAAFGQVNRGRYAARAASTMLARNTTAAPAVASAPAATPPASTTVPRPARARGVTRRGALGWLYAIGASREEGGGGTAGATRGGRRSPTPAGPARRRR